MPVPVKLLGSSTGHGHACRQVQDETAHGSISIVSMLHPRDQTLQYRNTIRIGGSFACCTTDLTAQWLKPGRNKKEHDRPHKRLSPGANDCGTHNRAIRTIVLVHHEPRLQQPRGCQDCLLMLFQVAGLSVATYYRTSISAKASKQDHKPDAKIRLSRRKRFSSAISPAAPPTGSARSSVALTNLPRSRGYESRKNVMMLCVHPSSMAGARVSSSK